MYSKYLHILGHAVLGGECRTNYVIIIIQLFIYLRAELNSHQQQQFSSLFIYVLTQQP
jgi:hypothetical protein